MADNGTRVAVPIDFSGEEAAAIDAALDLAGGDRVRVVHVLPPLDIVAPGVVFADVTDEDRERALIVVGLAMLVSANPWVAGWVKRFRTRNRGPDRAIREIEDRLPEVLAAPLHATDPDDEGGPGESKPDESTPAGELER